MAKSVGDAEETAKATRKGKGKNGVVVEEEPTEEVNGADSEEEGEGDGEEEEYEIEEILRVKTTGGVKQFWVKWKNYGHDENTWVNEADAGNATELIEEFMRKQKEKEKARGRKSVDAKSAKSSATAISRKSTRQASSEVGGASASAPIKKRSRAAKVTTEESEDVDQEDEDQMEVDEPVKKKRKSVAKPDPPAKKSKAKPEPEQTEDAEEEEMEKFITMDEYAHLESWYHVITSLDTVERGEDGSLSVYLSLTTNERAKASSEDCRKKCPALLIEFYEANLRWKTTVVAEKNTNDKI